MANIIEEKLLQDKKKADLEAAKSLEEQNKKLERDEAVQALKIAGIPQDKDANIKPGSWGGYNKEQLDQGKQFLFSNRQPSQAPAQDQVSTQVSGAATPAQDMTQTPMPQVSQPRALDFGASLGIKAAELEAKGQTDILKAQESQAKASGELINAEILKQQELQKQRADQQAISQDEIKKLEDDYSNTKLTDPDIWGKSSTGGKIFLALGALLSSASNQGAQAFRSGIQNAIDRDIDLQKANLAKKREGIQGKKSLYSQMLDRYKDEDLANLATRKLYLDKIEAETNMKIANAKSPLVQAAALRANSIIMKEKDELTANMQIKLAEQQGKGAERAEKNVGRVINTLGYQGTAPTEKEAIEFRAAAADAETAKKGIAELKKFTDGAFLKSLTPEQKAQAETQIGVLMGTIGKPIFGSLTESDREFMQTIIANPTKVFSLSSSDKARLNTLDKYVNSYIENKAQSIGLNTPTTMKAQKESALGIK